MSELSILMKSIFEVNNQYFKGAYEFIIGNYNSSNKHDLIGFMFAHEFGNIDKAGIVKRKDSER